MPSSCLRLNFRQQLTLENQCIRQHSQPPALKEARKCNVDIKLLQGWEIRHKMEYKMPLSKAWIDVNGELRCGLTTPHRGCRDSLANHRSQF